MLSVLAIIVPLIVLVIMIWKKVNIAVSAIVCTGLMALMSGLNIYDCLTNDYMEAFVGYIKNYWPLIFLGASFGKAMQLGEMCIRDSLQAGLYQRKKRGYHHYPEPGRNAGTGYFKSIFAADQRGSPPGYQKLLPVSGTLRHQDYSLLHHTGIGKCSGRG